MATKKTRTRTLKKPVHLTRERTHWRPTDLALESGVPLDTIRHWILKKKLPAVRVSRSVLIEKQDALHVISRKKPPQ